VPRKQVFVGSDTRSYKHKFHTQQYIQLHKGSNSKLRHANAGG